VTAEWRLCYRIYDTTELACDVGKKISDMQWFAESVTLVDKSIK
jgi:hypothetical protein